jgi:hypothetical protein
VFVLFSLARSSNWKNNSLDQKNKFLSNLTKEIML